MKKTCLVLITSAFISWGAAAAEDCGEPPVNYPTIPNGETSDAEQIRIARDAVVAYSDTVDAYIACMDQRGQLLLPYMSKDQRLRWDEDLANLHNKRRDMQTEMNMAIRSYRKTNN
ncbi:hypothetical protein [Kordiimonas pumila]|uniref:Uncharacterized protein n=1 Tax=Kordiimonas pumila TaxID=2161677 RepID=A0ABV7D5F7_9PROT|nr:hypothetical protein [Kordiimonas pumila]